MTQRDRDRLVVLIKARDKKLTQKQAGEELGVSERQVRRALRKLKLIGDKVAVHGLRGQASNRKLSQEKSEEIVEILSRPVYAGFGPTLAGEYLRDKHSIEVGRETVRKLMTEAKLWRVKRRRADAVHTWRPRRSRFGEMVQWDTSDHDWLEGRGPRMKLIRLIDDATSRTLLRFVEHDSTEANLGVLEIWLRLYGRMLNCYTDKASLFQNTEKHRRDQPGEKLDPRQMPPTQIGRALRELQIVWIAAHSPQAKGRVERGFGTDQDRLVKGLRVAGVATLEAANAYLESEYLPWWDKTCTVLAAHTDDAHRPLAPEHNLESILSHVESRKVLKDYTVRWNRRICQIDKAGIVAGLRDATVRVEQRRNGELAIAFEGKFLAWNEVSAPLKAQLPAAKPKTLRKAPATANSPWRQGYKNLRPRAFPKTSAG